MSGIQWRKSFTHLTTKSKPNGNYLFYRVPVISNLYYSYRMSRTFSLFTSYFIFLLCQLSNINRRRNERLAIIIIIIGIRFWSALQPINDNNNNNNHKTASMNNSKNRFRNLFMHLSKRMINYLTDCLIGKIGVVHWNNSFRMNCTENWRKKKEF